MNEPLLRRVSDPAIDPSISRHTSWSRNTSPGYRGSPSRGDRRAQSYSLRQQGRTRSDSRLDSPLPRAEQATSQVAVKVVSTCDEFDREKLTKLCAEQFGQEFPWSSTQDWLHVPLSPSSPILGRSAAAVSDSDRDICLVFFDYGVVVMWGLTNQESSIIQKNIVSRIAIRPQPKRFNEEDELTVLYYADSVEEPSIKDDALRLDSRLRPSVDARIAISHAVAQSTKLGVFEEQGLDLVQKTKHLPRELAEKGHCALSEKDLAKLIGRMFVCRSDVDLLSSALDQPEFFWNKPDSVSDLYKTVCDYYETEERIRAVNSRLEVTQSLLDMLQEREDKSHGSRLEWIVIVLVAIEGVFGLFEFLATIGFLPHWRGGGAPGANLDTVALDAGSARW